jgi:hypothetical protein
VIRADAPGVVTPCANVPPLVVVDRWSHYC